MGYYPMGQAECLDCTVMFFLEGTDENRQEVARQLGDSGF